ncbi:terminase large subunit domain-containing protein [Brevundimonas sp. UBA7664]|uniref:terminase large subunit domain-containing protein n=1 Tax=Brevundimonas sp. UBA7664 TaxID=1946141 RepID=UPI0025BBDF92|nr:terminase family protein [Brevundimonas sp. UBA7664]
MKLRPTKDEGAPDGGSEDLGALLSANGGFGFPVTALLDARRAAKFLYWACWRPVDIADLLGLPEGTIAAWKHRDEWDKSSTLERMEGVTEARYIALAMKDRKSGLDFKELDLLGRQAVQFARIRKFESDGGHSGHLNDKVAARNAGPKKKAKANVITAAQALQLREAFEAKLFEYQEGWNVASNEERTRVILKSRQIGATFYFALEAICDAVETGRNQIFLSASKNQAYLFRGYIVDFVFETIGVELRGDPLVIGREGDEGEALTPATLYFLGTNYRTAQGYHGNFYFDEFMWVHGFEEIQKVASAIAMQKRYRQTYFSTPSSITHPAYAFWTGESFLKHKPKHERQPFDVSHGALQLGKRLADRRWRQIVTIEDALAGGCDLFDLDELRIQYPPDQFSNLLMCNFVDDTLSVFPLTEMRRCQVDARDAWTDFDWTAYILGRRPFGDRPVWVGYDPAATGDNAALVVVAPPAVPGGKFRLLEKLQFTGMDFTAQAEAIRSVTKRYRVEKIDIDETGIGLAVIQLVRQFFPAVRGHRYNPEVKTRLVLKAKDVVVNARLEYDAGQTDVTASFMAIRKALTASGRQATYEAGRSALTGHADLFWAIAHALDNEALEAPSNGGRTGSMMEIFD